MSLLTTTFHVHFSLSYPSFSLLHLSSHINICNIHICVSNSFLSVWTIYTSLIPHLIWMHICFQSPTLFLLKIRTMSPIKIISVIKIMHECMETEMHMLFPSKDVYVWFFKTFDAIYGLKHWKTNKGSLRETS